MYIKTAQVDHKVVGWILIFISILMAGGAIGALLITRIVGASPEQAFGIPRHVFFFIAWGEIFLAASVLVASIRFVALHRWTILPLFSISVMLCAAMPGFLIWWITRSKALFGRTAEGSTDPMETMISTTFQLISIVGGIVVIRPAMGVLGCLAKYLRSARIREVVNRSGF